MSACTIGSPIQIKCLCPTDQQDIGCICTDVNLPIRRPEAGGQGSTDAGACAYPIDTFGMCGSVDTLAN